MIRHPAQAVAEPPVAVWWRKLAAKPNQARKQSGLNPCRRAPVRKRKTRRTRVFQSTIQVLASKLEVMDLTAICLCRDHHMPVRVFAMDKPGALLSIVMGGDEGTLID